jgi:hypothetical protein
MHVGRVDPTDGRLGYLLTALVDDVEGGVRDVVVFEKVVGGGGEGADEDRVVLWGDEGDGGEAQVGLTRHREPEPSAKAAEPSSLIDKFPFPGTTIFISLILIIEKKKENLRPSAFLLLLLQCPRPHTHPRA